MFFISITDRSVLLGMVQLFHYFIDRKVGFYLQTTKYHDLKKLRTVIEMKFIYRTLLERKFKKRR